jgi:hypothetical protein
MEEPEENQTTVGEHELPEISAEHLDEQIELVRQLAQAAPPVFREPPLSPWKQVVYPLLVFGVLFLVVFLLIFERSRQQLITSMGEGFNSAYADRQREILRLPPPPPEAIQTRTVMPAGRVSIGGADEEPGGVLFLDKQPPGLGREKEEAPTQAVILAKNPFNEAAYNLLKATSETAAELIGNNIAEFEFQDWRPVKDDPPEAWIDLVVTRRADGELLHLIWSVNTETERTSPLSQAARDLQGR